MSPEAWLGRIACREQFQLRKPSRPDKFLYIKFLPRQVKVRTDACLGGNFAQQALIFSLWTHSQSFHEYLSALTNHRFSGFNAFAGRHLVLWQLATNLLFVTLFLFNMPYTALLAKERRRPCKSVADLA